MIFRNIYEYKFWVAQHRYHGRITPNYCDGMRKDIWIFAEKCKDAERKQRKLNAIESQKILDAKEYERQLMHEWYRDIYGD